jgi:hypothetical protein
MPEMADHDLRTSFDALSARLQAELQAQAAQLADRIAEERAKARAEADTEREAAVEAVRQEWNGRLQAGLADAAAESDARHRHAMDALRDEWQGRLQAGLADAASDADRRLQAETERLRGEAEAATAEAVERARADARREAEAAMAAAVERAREDVRRDMEQAAAHSAAELRADMERAVAHATTSLRVEMEQAASHATARLREEMDQAVAAERERANADLARASAELADLNDEHNRVQTLLADERNRAASDVEGERLKVQTLSAALEEARAALARERDAVRAAEASLAAARSELQTSGAQAIVDARAAERQSHVAIVERLLGAMQTIGQARSLGDTLTALTTVAATLAPRAALFIVHGSELRPWRSANLDGVQPSMVLGEQDAQARALLDRALEVGGAVTTTTAPAPPFARLPKDRSGMAVPVVVGGHGVAVLYADDGTAAEPDAPSAWPEAIEALAAHASACVSQITAVRTAQALQQQLGAPGSAPAAGPAATEDDSSARRYARLLVSEIKLYNETAVRTGRERRDLLHRLRPEIDRARRLYEERVSPAVGARSAYFQQELVHTLADGDSALLGGTL